MTIPLAIHGVVVTKNNKVIEVSIGEEESDPVFCITDLLIHLSAENMDKKAAKVIEGEALDILIGSRPLSEGKKDEKEKEAVKSNVLRLLEEKYGIDEEDFISAELEIVPAGKARDCGVAILNMHVPWEISSKADIYEAVKCYEAFLKDIM